MSLLDELPDRQLSVVVFGPGFGETVLVRVPPDEWLVVDSLRDVGSRKNPGLELLAQYGVSPSLLILTHPHEDHSTGFDDLVAAQESGLVGCVDCGLEPADPLTEPDCERAIRAGRAMHALAAIRDRWDRDSDSVWRLEMRSEASLGEATVTVLSPTATVVARAQEGYPLNVNKLSAAVAVRWRGVGLVLGADLPATDWLRMVREWPGAQPGDHIALKVPHHGSRASQPALLAEPPDGRNRTWILTPWNRGRTLPRFEDGEGIALILGRVGEVRLTSLPFAAAVPACSQPVTRQQVLRSIERSRFGDDDMVLDYLAGPPQSSDGWVAAVFDEDGELASVEGGNASWTVVPG